MPKKRNYAGQLAYQKREQPRKDQAARQRARRAYEKKHGKTPPGKELNHKQPMMAGGSNSQSNLEVAPIGKNRGYRRNRQNRPI